MMGIQDPWVWLAYVLSILSALLCVVWGAARWNREETEEPPEEVQRWAKAEDDLEQEL